MSTHHSTADSSNPSSDAGQDRQTILRKTSIASEVSPRIVDTLNTFVQQSLGVEPSLKAYRTLWECAWMNRAGELTVFLNNDGTDGEFFLSVIYIEQLNNPPPRSLHEVEIEHLCRRLHEQTGLPVRSAV
jgi:hypothetical protein